MSEDRIDNLARELRVVGETTARLEGKLDTFMNNTTSYVGAVNRKVDEHIREGNEERRDRRSQGVNVIGILFNFLGVVLGCFVTFWALKK